jgi:predicted  nucleic acid-binding Zn-ribbon protein
MPINVTCECGKTFEVGDQFAGKPFPCITCGQEIQVPDPLPDAAPDSTTAPQELAGEAAATGAAAVRGARWPLIAGGVTCAGIIVAVTVLFVTTNKRLADANTRLDDANTRLADANNRLDDSNNRLDDANNRLQQLEARAAASEDNAETQEAATNSLKANLTQAETNLATLEQKLSEATAQQARDKQQLQTLEGKASSLKDNISKLNTDIRLNQQAIRNNDQAAIAARQVLADKMQTAQNELTQAENDISTLEGKILVAETQIANWQQQATNMQQAIASLETLTTNLASQPVVSPTQFALAIQQLQKADQQMWNAYLTDRQNYSNWLMNNHIGPIRGEIAELQPQRYKTVVGERKTAGPTEKWCALRLDTQTGAATCIVEIGNPNPRKAQIAQPNTAGLWGANALGATYKPGRFDTKVTFKENGDVADALLVDTQSGVLWKCDPADNPPAWVQIDNYPLGWSWGAGQPLDRNNRFRIEVDPSNSAQGNANKPPVFLTDGITNFTYSDEASWRNQMARLLP